MVVALIRTVQGSNNSCLGFKGNDISLAQMAGISNPVDVRRDRRGIEFAPG